ncbi:hypothetical protein CN918_32275 [Priestia megaterium]|nr:hypothetical protein CN918_32275 [Priestia megaterium]
MGRQNQDYTKPSTHKKQTEHFFKNVAKNSNIVSGEKENTNEEDTKKRTGTVALLERETEEINTNNASLKTDEGQATETSTNDVNSLRKPETDTNDVESLRKPETYISKENPEVKERKYEVAFTEDENRNSYSKANTSSTGYSISQSFDNKINKKGIEDTHIRKTFFINRELFDIFDGLCKVEKKGYKTHVINEALRIALIEIYKENGAGDDAKVLQQLYALAPQD